MLHVPVSTHLAVDSARHVDIARALKRSVVLHRGDFVRSATDSPGEQVVHPVAALKAASRCLSPREHLVVADAMLHAGLITDRDLVFGGGGTSARSAWLMTRADARAESPLETLARLELVEGGLAVQPQVHIRGVGRVDLVVEGKLVVETDGREFHDTDDAFARDRKRDRALHGLGFVVLRFIRKDVVSTPGLVLADTLRALRAVTARAA
jgi:very-short-patch-repair endonuclease